MKKPLIGVLFATLFFVSPVLTHAMTVSEILARIADLTSQLNRLSSTNNNSSGTIITVNPISSPIVCTGLVMPIITEIPYSYLTDNCGGDGDGYRNVQGNKVSSACYNKQECQAISGANCVNITIAKSQCSFSTSTQPFVSVNSANVSDYEGTVRVDWSSNQNNGVMFMVDTSVSDLSGLDVKDAVTGEDIYVSRKLPSSGSMYLKIQNFTNDSKKLVLIFDPLDLNGNQFYDHLLEYRKTLTINVKASDIAPVITKITPATGIVGTKVTIHGKNFLSTNTIDFESTLANSNTHPSGSKQFTVSSREGNTLSFIIPDTITQSSEAYVGTKEVKVMSGKYLVAVDNANGKSGIVYFDVISPKSKSTR